MSKHKFKLNRQGVRELMQSVAMQEILQEKGSNALSRLGSGYDMSTHVGHTRANVTVFADSYKAKRENMKNNTILKAVK